MRRQARLVMLGVLGVLGACAQGAPPGFSSAGGGDRWALPLVGPLENGLLITAASINTHGPYLFAIDPDAPISIVDSDVVKDAELRTFPGPHRLDESDTQQPRFYAELIGLEIGDLIIERRDAMVVRSGAFAVAGRKIAGVLGRDVIADSLAFGIDREHGLVHLVTQNKFTPPSGAATFGFQELAARIPNVDTQPVARRLLDATINGTKVTLHLDFGAPASQLRDAKWDDAKLVARDVQTAVIDEVGMPRRVTRASQPATVALGALRNERVVFIPYADKRWDELHLDGTLGLGFFAAHEVWTSWHAKQLHAVPRRDVPAATRIGRWDSAVLAKCAQTGCITHRLVDPLAGKPLAAGRQHPGVVLSITRDAVAGGTPLEVVLEASGRPDLPYLLVNLPAHVDRVLHQLPGIFVGTTLAVVDASLYPRTCPGRNGCVDQLAR